MPGDGRLKARGGALEEEKLADVDPIELARQPTDLEVQIGERLVGAGLIAVGRAAGPSAREQKERQEEKERYEETVPAPLARALPGQAPPPSGSLRTVPSQIRTVNSGKGH
jgi:hypothetical protein